jgi:hypothetical protein
VEIAEDWRKLYNREFHDTCFTPNIIRVMKSRRTNCAYHMARTVEKRNACRDFVVRREGRRSLGRRRRRWEDSIKMHLKNVGKVRTVVLWLKNRDKWRTLVSRMMNIRLP